MKFLMCLEPVERELLDRLARTLKMSRRDIIAMALRQVDPTSVESRLAAIERRVAELEHASTK